MKFHSPETLAAIAGVARRHDVLLILDEIATGFGRTGTLFACEQAGLVPDLIALSKALTGGTLPLGVRDVRIKGAIGVVELEREPKLEALRARFVAQGVWVRPFGNVVYLMPPLVIGADDLARLTAAVHTVLIEAAAAAAL